MVNLQQLKDMKDKNLITEDVYLSQKRRIAERILKKGGESSKNSIVYVILAFWVGCIGIHNFYAGYWKRGLLQLLLTLVSPYMMFVPLLFTSVWALIELLFVNRAADGSVMSGNRKIVFGLRALTIISLLWFASVSESVLDKVDVDILQQVGDDITQTLEFENDQEVSEDFSS